MSLLLLFGGTPTLEIRTAGYSRMQFFFQKSASGGTTFEEALALAILNDVDDVSTMTGVSSATFASNTAMGPAGVGNLSSSQAASLLMVLQSAGVANLVDSYRVGVLSSVSQSSVANEVAAILLSEQSEISQVSVAQAVASLALPEQNAISQSIVIVALASLLLAQRDDTDLSDTRGAFESLTLGAQQGSLYSLIASAVASVSAAIGASESGSTILTGTSSQQLQVAATTRETAVMTGVVSVLLAAHSASISFVVGRLISEFVSLQESSGVSVLSTNLAAVRLTEALRSEMDSQNLSIQGAALSLGISSAQFQSVSKFVAEQITMLVNANLQLAERAFETTGEMICFTEGLLTTPTLSGAAIVTATMSNLSIAVSTLDDFEVLC